MNFSLPDLIHNLYERIFNSIVCTKCMGKEYCFVGLKNDELIYRCRKCKEEWERSNH